MSMSLKEKTKTFLRDLWDIVVREKLRVHEDIKFQDPRRKAIYQQIRLTDEQKAQIDALYTSNYGHKISYTWHRHYTAFTGKFDAGYIPENIYIPEFERFMNPKSAYAEALADKNVLPILARVGGVKTPAFYVCSSAGILRDKNYSEISSLEAAEILNNVGKVFIKPTVDSDSGKGCRVANFVDGIDIESNTPIQKYLTQLGADWVIQKRLRCSESIRRIYPDSVNTFRVITYRWRDTVCTMPVMMRIGRSGNYLDNAHAGGMFIAVDDDGTLHDRAFTEFKEEFTKHPDTGVVFENYKIENFPKVLEAAKRMSSMVPQVGCVHWDFTIDDEGEPLLIEGNMKFGSVWMIEMARGVAPFGERTEEVLRWLGKMRKTKASERYKYLYGKE